MKISAARWLGSLLLIVPFVLPADTACSYVDDFEPAANAGWVVNTAVNAGPSSQPWTVGTEAAAHSASNAFKTDAATLDEKDDRLVSPPQNLTATSHLVFWHKFFTEGFYDGGVLEISTDGGTTWVDVVTGGGSFVSGGYTDVIDSCCGSPIAGRNAWTGVSAGYPTAMDMVEVDVGAYAGPARLIRWRFVADVFDPTGPSIPGDVWAIDDVEFTNLDGCDGGGGEETPPELVVHFHGNPTHSAGHPNEPTCSGTGASDVPSPACDGPFLSPAAELGSGAAGHWDATTQVDGTGADGRNIYDPQWLWHLTEPVTLKSPMKPQWWGACGACTSAGWTIRLFVDGAKIVEQVVTATPAAPNVTSLLTAEVALPTAEVVATTSVLLHIDPAFSVAPTQENTHIYYDSTAVCPGATDPGIPCDSKVVFGGLPPAAESACVVPGVTLFDDLGGDSTGAPEQDLKHAWIAQPYAASGTPNLIFSLEAGKGTGLTPSSMWFISFLAPDGETRGIQAVTDTSGVPTFTSYIVDVSSSTNAKDGRTVQSGSSKPLETGSGYDAATGRFIFVVKPADIGVTAAGEKLSGINAGVLQVVQTPAGSATQVKDQMPDGSVTTARPASEYAVPANADCAANAAPTAILSAAPSSADVDEDVAFTVTGSDPDGDDLLSFTLDFGDGFQLVDEPFSEQSLVVHHAYATAGPYTASLSVKDATGRLSSTPDTVNITVAGPPVAHLVAPTTVDEGDPIVLDGSTSNDGNRGTLNYAWSSTPAIPGLSSNTGPTASVTAPSVCTSASYAVKLTVSNAGGTAFEQATVTVNNVNQNPVANAGADRTVARGEAVTLSASGSADPDTCQDLDYAWTQFAGPPVELSSTIVAEPSFTAPSAGNVDTILYFRVTVTDTEGEFDSADVTITVSGRPVGFTKILGGGLPPLNLALLGLLAGLRRRR